MAGGGDLKRMGRIGVKAIVYFEIVTTAALFLGLAAVNLVRPGVGVPIERTAAEAAVAPAPATASSLLERVVPASIVDAMARNDALQIVVFAFLFGAACAAVGAKAQPVASFCAALAEVMFRYTRYVMVLAPLGVGAALAVTVGSKGLGVLFGLGKLILTMYASLAVFVVVVLGAVLAVARIPLAGFYRAVREPFLIAFSTASSEAALPLALENMELFGVPKHIVGFVIPTGYSFNLDGSTLYLSLASVFVAQAAGVNLSFGQQLLMMLTLMLTSKGLAGVPRAALVILAGTLTTFHLPMEGAAVLLGVDALMDMARTSINVIGNCLASAVVARWEGYRLVRNPDGI
jgi:proton glutamate symport protein